MYLLGWPYKFRAVHHIVEIGITTCRSVNGVNHSNLYLGFVCDACLLYGAADE